MSHRRERINVAHQRDMRHFEVAIDKTMDAMLDHKYGKMLSGLSSLAITGSKVVFRGAELQLIDKFNPPRS